MPTLFDTLYGPCYLTCNMFPWTGNNTKPLSPSVKTRFCEYHKAYSFLTENVSSSVAPASNLSLNLFHCLNNMSQSYLFKVEWNLSTAPSDSG